MADVKTCPACGAALPLDAPAGNCPGCLMRQVLPGTEPAKPLFRFFGDYELIEEIAHGGMGIVYRARQISLHRSVALKMILAGHLATPSLVQRFRAEAEAAARLDHPNIVPIYEIGEHDGQHYYSMKLIEGRNLARHLEDKCKSEKGQPAAPSAFNSSSGATLMAIIARALHHAHQRGILHRDLKPTNIVLDVQGKPYVSDFGLAKILEDNIDLTQSMAVLGTPAYMAPEQATGHARQLTTAADVYSLGAILYELLTGRPPFRAETALATMREVAEREPVPPRTLNPKLERSLETICLKCLEKDPSKRYASAEVLAEDLDRFVRGEPVQARRVSQPERLWRWCRRKPALAGAVAGLIVTFIVAFVAVSWQWKRAEANAAKEARQRAHVQDMATRLMLDRAELLFREDRSADVLGQLAQVLRQSPSHPVVAQRILSALGQRNFCLPVAVLRHQGEITSVQFRRDGSQVLTSSRDKTARLLEGRTLQVLFELSHQDAVASARFNSNENQIVTASRDQTAQIWDARTGRRVGLPLRHSQEVHHAEFSSRGDRVLTVCADGRARLWDAGPGQVLLTLGQSNILAAHFSPDGRQIVTSSGDQSIRVWNAESGETIGEVMHNRWESSDVQFTPDGKRLLVGSADLFETASGKLWSRQFPLHTPKIYSAQFSLDGARVVTASADSTARIWDFATGASLSGPLQHDNRVLYANFSADGLSVVTCGNDRTVRVWDALTGRALTEPLWHDAEVRFAQFSPDGHHLITQPAGHTAWLWEIRQLHPLTPAFAHGEAVRTAHFTKDGKRLLTASWDQTAKLWDVQTGQLLIKPFQHGRWVSSAEFSPDERWIVTASHDGTARVWDTQTGAAVARMQHRGIVHAAAFSADSQSVLTASEDGTAQLWDARSGRSRVGPLPHGAAVHAAHFSPDGKHIVTASSDKTARIWNVQTGQEEIPPLLHEQPVQNARFAPDGQRVVTVALDHVARVWDVRTGRQLLAVPHDDEFDLSSPQFSPEGLRVATASRNTVRIWSVVTGQPLVEPMRHAERVTSIQFDRSGKRLVTTSKDQTARIWDAMKALPLSEPLMHTSGVVLAEFSQDGKWLVTAGYDGLARIWNVQEYEDDVPSWLSDLAEAVGGKRFDAQNFSSNVSVERLFLLTTELRGILSSNSYPGWVKWFLAEGASRTLTPASPLTVSEYVEQCVRNNTVPSLRSAVRLAPGNGQAFARLALQLFAHTNRSVNATREYWSYAKRAVELSPQEAEAWLTLAKMLEGDGRSGEALEVVTKAAQALPTHPAVWNAQGILLQRAHRWEEARRAFSQAIELTGGETSFGNVRARAFQGRSEVGKQLGRPEEARADFLQAKGIPASPGSRAQPNLIDLTPYYNAGLSENWRGLYEKDDLALLPRGLQRFGQTEFDVRGVIQLSGQGLQRHGRRFPQRVEGIKVGQACDRLHFLHAAGYLPGATHGTEIARYIVQFTNGEKQEIPVVFGCDVLRHWVQSVPARGSAGPVLAWKGMASPTNAPTAGLFPALYSTTWTNPWPQVRIESLDFVSAMSEVDAFLVAVTADQRRTKD